MMRGPMHVEPALASSFSGSSSDSSSSSGEPDRERPKVNSAEAGVAGNAPVMDGKSCVLRRVYRVNILLCSCPLTCAYMPVPNVMTF